MPLSIKKHAAAAFLVFFLFALTMPAVSFAEPQSASKPAAKAEKILLNFVDVDIVTVVNFISKLTGKNFIYDERVSGKVTIVAPSKITMDEAFDLFTSVLELKGYSIIDTGAAYKIVPASEAKQSPVSVETAVFRVNEAYIARLIPLTHIQTQDIVPTLQPLVSKQGYISAFGKGNSILVVDSALNIEKILHIVKLLDTGVQGATPELVFLKNAQADTVVQTLRLMKGGAMPGANRPVAGNEAYEPVADNRLNAIILFGPKEKRDEHKALISMLDIPAPESGLKINVYYLENAEAAELEKSLKGLLRMQPVERGAAPGAPPAPPMPQLMTELTGKVFINADPSTNSLIIMAAPEDYQNILQVIKKLDRRPKQVFVEAMITEVSVNKTLELGAKWRASAQKDGEPVIIGGIGTVNTSTLQSVLNGMAGLTIGGVGNFVTVPVTQPDGTTVDLTVPGFAALFSLSEFRDIVDVLSTPHILTSDNKEAEIMVGENVPFLSKIEREGTTASQPVLQSIERKDVGITLRIKPQISEGEYIKLEIYQEISAIAPTTTQQASDIITTKRSAKTSVVVKDKQTVVIGGLIQDKDVITTTKVPLLGDIPILGWLFKSRTKGKQKTNLLVYLTPTIVRDFGDMDSLRERKEEEYEKNKALNSKEAEKKTKAKE